jgi:TatD DNase family protein
VIDTHAHLDALEDPAGAVARARAAGVDRIVAIGSGVASTHATIAIAEAEPGVAVAAGVHPHQAADGEPVDRLLDDRVVAVGEIGLDFFRDYAPREEQRRVFTAQLRLAAEHGKPVVVHSRAADDETAELLAEFHGTVVLHCFSSPALLPFALDQSWYVSFAGNVTYPRAEELRAAAVQVPQSRILAETDTPYLAPQPRRGRPNEPANVVHTVETLAAVRGVPTEELAAQIDANANAAFSLP